MKKDGFIFDLQLFADDDPDKAAEVETEVVAEEEAEEAFAPVKYDGKVFNAQKDLDDYINKKRDRAVNKAVKNVKEKYNIKDDPEENEQKKPVQKKEEVDLSEKEKALAIKEKMIDLRSALLEKDLKIPESVLKRIKLDPDDDIEEIIDELEKDFEVQPPTQKINPPINPKAGNEKQPPNGGKKYGRLTNGYKPENDPYFK